MKKRQLLLDLFFLLLTALAVSLSFWSCAIRMEAAKTGELAEARVPDNVSLAGDITASARIRFLNDDLAVMLANGDPEHPVSRLYNDVAEYLHNGRIRMDIYREADYPDERGVLFRFIDSTDRQGKMDLVLAFPREMLIQYGSNRAALMSRYVYSLKQLHDFISNEQAYRAAMHNRLEKYVHDMDALYYQAMFLKDYSELGDSDIGDYEKLLIRSLKEDNLGRASLYLKKTDMDLLYAMYRLRVRCIDQEMTLSDYLASLVLLGEKVLEQVRLDSEWNTVVSAVKMYTYDFFLPYCTNDLWANATEQEDLVFSRFSDRLNEIKTEMRELVSRYDEVLTNFYAEIMEKYSKTP
ncbi:MAG: hypothetical protein JW874_09255 [Spirochaetales bacterium]|nr:hypothetical protein [Spirochaetales bacterium]